MLLYGPIILQIIY